MDGDHFLNLRTLASEDVGNFALFRFEGRDALSEAFDYRLELVCYAPPDDLGIWLGQLVEWDITANDDQQRLFAGRIYETDIRSTGEAQFLVMLRVRPAYHATAYARATHFVQDRNAQQIFEAMTADVPGLVTSLSLSAAPPTRTMTVRYDETEFDFLQRVLAQDGITYFFTYDDGAPPYKHRMRVLDSPSGYVDIDGMEATTLHGSAASSSFKTLSSARHAAPGGNEFHALDINKADTPWTASADGQRSIYARNYEDLAGEAAASGDLTGRSKIFGQAYAGVAAWTAGTSDSIHLFAGGRIEPEWIGRDLAKSLVVTAVTHHAYDPWMFERAEKPSYSNSFTATDASLPYRPPLPNTRRRAPGPLLGVVSAEGKADGEVVVDDESRIPVAIVPALQYASLPKPLTDIVWLPVQQHWASSTHGAQFFPRIGARVVIDFLYGDPDLPFVAGSLYTPSAKYPFDPSSNATQTGWRSITDKNGSVMQELMFEDKPGSEEVYLYTGRNNRRQVDNDEIATVNHDQTLVVKNDQTSTIQHDQKITVQNDQTEEVQHDQMLTVDNNRTINVTAKESHTVKQTRTLTVSQKSSHESYQEIDLVVGGSSIKLTPTSIEIKSTMIKISADATLDVSAEAMATYKAPLTQVNADGMLILKGGIVMIN